MGEGAGMFGVGPLNNETRGCLGCRICTLRVILCKCSSLLLEFVYKMIVPKESGDIELLFLFLPGLGHKDIVRAPVGARDFERNRIDFNRLQQCNDLPDQPLQNFHGI